MAKKDNAKKPKSEKSKSAPQSVDLNVGGNMEKSVVVIGDNNIVNYYEIVSTNTEQHDPDYWNLKHPYPMPPNFTGRVAERAMLTQSLNEDSENHLFILRALGGFGKSALTWHWLTHDVIPAEWPKVIFWSFYEGDASFEHFIEETLKYLKLEVPQGQRPQVDELLRAMQTQKILLIMDGFERALRAYSSMNAAYQGDEEPKLEDTQLDCVNINAEIFLKSVCSLPSIKSKVLMTTRLTPRAIKPRGEFMLGCREEELTAMQKEDAVEFFRKQKIKGTHAEIEAACFPYGYHPLSLRILVGLITDDRETPGDIVAANKLDITDDVIANKHHVLEVSFNTLLPGQQKLVSNIACFRSQVKYKELKIIYSVPLRKRNKTKSNLAEKLQDNLQTLENRGLLQWNRKTNKYDLHPIVRRYAYERLTIPERLNMHTRLRDYFATVNVPVKPQTPDDLVPIIELYHHTIQARELDEAFRLFHDRLHEILYYHHGSYQTIIELIHALFLHYEDNTPSLKNGSEKAWILNVLANAYSLSGQPRRAVPLFERHNAIRQKTGNMIDAVIGLENIAYMAQVPIGALHSAETNLQQSIDLCKEVKGRRLWETIGHVELGHLLAYLGMWDKVESEIEPEMKYLEAEKNFQGQSVAWLYRAMCSLLIARDINLSSIDNHKLVIEYAQRALELANKWAKTQYPMKRDFVRAHWVLGAAYRLDGQLDLAEQHLSEALTRGRVINLVENEADILLDFARLRYDQKSYEEAKSMVDEALTITERCGYVLQGADVNLFLAQYALEQEKDKVKAKEYAESALKLAYCDGPPYYYKVAYEEAERMLEKLK